MTTVETTRPLGLVAVAEKVFGERMSPKQRELLASLDHTPNAVWACGRRGGKTRLSAIVALADLFFNPAADEAIGPGDERKSVVVGTNKDQGRLLLNYHERLVGRRVERRLNQARHPLKPGAGHRFEPGAHRHAVTLLHKPGALEATNQRPNRSL